MVYLILSAGLKMFKKLPRTPFNVCVFAVTFCCMIGFALFSVRFSSVFFVLISAALALALYGVARLSHKEKGGDRS